MYYNENIPGALQFSLGCSIRRDTDLSGVRSRSCLEGGMTSKVDLSNFFCIFKPLFQLVWFYVLVISMTTITNHHKLSVLETTPTYYFTVVKVRSSNFSLSTYAVGRETLPWRLQENLFSCISQLLAVTTFLDPCYFSAFQVNSIASSHLSLFFSFGKLSYCLFSFSSNFLPLCGSLWKLHE